MTNRPPRQFLTSLCRKCMSGAALGTGRYPADGADPLGHIPVAPVHCQPRSRPGIQASSLAMALTGLLFLSPAAFAQDGKQSLSQAANDPTASLMAFQLQDFYTSPHHGGSGDRNIVQFRAAIPFRLGNTNNIARLTLPYVTSNDNGGTGLGDATLFDLVVFSQPWGRWGIGAVALLPTGADNVSAKKWALGPAVGFMAKSPGLLWGVFNQNLFTVGGVDAKPDVNISTLQPLVNKSLGNGWSVGTSEMTFAYDWEQKEFTSLPLGVKLSKLVRIKNVLPVQFQLSYEHNFYDKHGAKPEDTIGFTAKILLPK